MRIARTILTLRMLWELRASLFQATAIALLFSALVSTLLPRRFVSTTRLMPSNLVDPAALMESRTLQDNLINKFDLKQIYRDWQWEDARNDLAHHTAISEDRKSGIVTLAVTDKSPQRAAAMAQEYTDELNRIAVQLNRTSAHLRRQYLERELARVTQELEAAELNLSAFSGGTGEIDVQEQTNSIIKTTGDLRKKLIAEQADLQSLKSVYGEGSPEIRSNRARINELRHASEKLIGAPAAANDTEDESYQTMRKIPLLGVDYADLNRTVRLKEETVALLNEEYRSVQFVEANDTPLITVLDPPDLSDKGSWPLSSWSILAATFCSLFPIAAWLISALRPKRAQPR
jgi:capsule polysaccharide export protein KpsE/RkpR